MNNDTIKVTVLDDETAEVEVALPAKYDVCPRCNGRGTHDHPAFANGITSDEWHGPDWDEESQERYMSGFYDVTCTVCHGQRVVLTVDEERLTPEQRATWTKFVELQSDMAQDDASERHLRTMESGGY